MGKQLKILILEDSPVNAALIQQQLKIAKIKFEAKVVSTPDGLSEALEKFVPDVILSDHTMPLLSSMDALKILKTRKFKVPFILVTSSVSQEFVVQIMKEGANDYILKDSLGSLPGAILNALEKHNLENESQRYIDELLAKGNLLSKVEHLAHIGSWQSNLITKEVTWADETFRIYGYSPGQIEPSREAFLISIHPDDQLETGKAIQDALAGNTELLKINYRILNKHNGLRYLYSELYIERDKTHQPTLITGFVQDVTTSKMAEEILHRSQKRLLESQIISHVGSWEILDLSVNDPLNGSPLYWSDEVFRIFGMEPGESDITTNSFLQMVHPDDRDAVNLEFKHAFDNGTVYNIDHRIIRKDKTERIVYERGEIIYDPKTRKRLKMIGTVQDITERKRAEDAKEKIGADLLQRNKDLEQFTYIVSHNLRAPVANLMGFSEALFDKNVAEDQKKEVAIAFSDSVNRLDEVIRDLNDILKVKSDVSEMKEIVKLSAIVDEIKVNNHQLIKKENATIKTNFTTVDELLTNKNYMNSIFYNLISNGIKYHRTDVSPLIEINGIKKDNKVILSFKDNGLGIDLKKRGSQVFGLYKRFHSSIEGKGVGLFMVKTQVERLGGKISISSKVNKGTKFTIELSP